MSASRAAFLAEIAERAAYAARRILSAPVADTFDDDAYAEFEFGDFFSQVLSTLDNSSSNPELEGLTDNSGGPVSDLNGLLADVYDAAAARVGVAGSSGINFAVHGALLPPLAPGAAVLIDRDAHLSVLGGYAFSGAPVLWLQRSYDPTNDVQRPLTPEQVSAALAAHPEIGAVALTSPTYDGFDVDIEAIARVCHARNAILVIDGAWGAGYGVLNRLGFPQSPIRRGADVAVVSLHKKGFAPSQIAVGLFSDARYAELFDAAGNLGLQTTSPNFILLAVTRHLIAGLHAGRYDSAWRKALAGANAFAGRLPEIHPAFRRIEAADVGASSGDPGHLLIHVGGAGVTGFAMKDALSKLDHDAEKATRDTLLMLVSPRAKDVDARLGEMRTALEAAAAAPKSTGARTSLIAPAPPTSAPMTIRAAALSASGWAPLQSAAGRIAAGLVSVYPPGSALLAPGERIEQRHLDYLRAVLAEGGRVRGLNSEHDAIRVISAEG
jgi:lysine decarboxylase